MQQLASRSPFDVACDIRRQFLAATSSSDAIVWRGLIWRVAFLLVVGLQQAWAADSEDVLLDFTAKWCGPCQQMSPIVSKLERQGLPIRKVDIDNEPALASRFNVKSIPCFVLVANGREIDRITGLTTEQQLRGMLNRLPKPAPAVAQKRDETRSGNSGGGLGKPTPLGSMDQSLPKKAPIGLPFLGGKQKAKEPRIDELALDDVLVDRGQNPDNLTTDPLRASVRLRVQDGTGINFGSGTIIDSKPGRSVILTCGHIFRKTGNESKVEVDVFGPNPKSRPETLVGKVLHFDLQADVGVITIAHSQQLPVVRLGATRELAVKDRVLSIGCGGGDKPSREDLSLTALNKYDGPDNIECTGMPQQGRSGGGLFLGADLIGVCIAADPKEQRGIYAGLQPIAQLLDKVGLGHLAPTPPAKDGGIAEIPGEVKTADLVEPSIPERGPATNSGDIEGLIAQELAAAMSGPATAPSDFEDAEVICIVRPKKPGAQSRVVIVNQASTRFIGDLLHESQPSAERATAKSETNRIGTDRRPIETSLDFQPYRRQRD